MLWYKIWLRKLTTFQKLYFLPNKHYKWNLSVDGVDCNLFLNFIEIIRVSNEDC